MSRNSHAAIKVLIADDHTIVRAGLTALLGTEKDLEIVGQAQNGFEAVKETLRLKPDVVIMDLMMPKKDGVKATAEIHEQSPSTKVILLTTFGTSDGIAYALQKGAKGAILKSADNAQLATAIRKVASGGEYRHSSTTRKRSADSRADASSKGHSHFDDTRPHRPRHRPTARNPTRRRQRPCQRHSPKAQRGQSNRSRQHCAQKASAEDLKVGGSRGGFLFAGGTEWVSRSPARIRGPSTSSPPSRRECRSRGRCAG